MPNNFWQIKKNPAIVIAVIDANWRYIPQNLLLKHKCKGGISWCLTKLTLAANLCNYLKYVIVKNSKLFFKRKCFKNWSYHQKNWICNEKCSHKTIPIFKWIISERFRWFLTLKFVRFKHFLITRHIKEILF